MLKILLFGATGSIGAQTLNVIKKNKFKLVGFTFHSNKVLAKKIATKFNVNNYFCTNDNDDYLSMIKKTKPDLIVNAVSGFAGVEVSLACIKGKIDLCLANKETLVTCGQFVIPLAKRNKISIYPIDSEHAGVLLLLKNAKNKTKEIILTASGGPFYKYSKKQLEEVNYSNAIKHPNWVMGEKVSIDSATLINKALEVVEAYWLFETKEISMILHPQSLVHAIIKDEKNNCAALSFKTSMEIPINIALNKFAISTGTTIHKYPMSNKSFVFEKISHRQLKGHKYAKSMIRDVCGAIPVIVNAADEFAISLFKKNKIAFLDIYKLIDLAIKKFKSTKISSINDVFALHNRVTDYLRLLK